jgi:hydrogenase maturation protease
VGNPDRGDDGVGPAVVARATPRLLGLVPPVRVLDCADPTELVHLWAGAGLTVVVDAVGAQRGERPGSLVLLRSGVGEPPLPSGIRCGAGGTHALGLAEAVELARALDRLPRRLVVLGVRAAGFAPGEPLSPQVAAAVEAAADRVCRLLR